VYQRGGGIPLLTEALVNSDGTVSAELPASLRDLLLAAVAALPERTQHALRIAAAGGVRLSHLLLVGVTGLDDAALTTALRPAVDANVLVSDSDGYAFRHQLIREAVLEEMLPGERAQAHRAFAGALEDRLEAGSRDGPEGTLVVLAALHWRGAQDDERALAAAWRAAGAAEAALAYAQRLRMLEQVLELWDRYRPATTRRRSSARSAEFAADGTGRQRSPVRARAAHRCGRPAGSGRRLPAGPPADPPPWRGRTAPRQLACQRPARGRSAGGPASERAGPRPRR